MDLTALGLATFVAAAAAVAFLLEARYRWAARVGATLLAILFGALASNLGLVPASSAVYDAVAGPVTSLAIAWLLLAVDLRDLVRAGPRMLSAFALAVIATSIAALAVILTAAPLLEAGVRQEAWKLGGVLTGTYSGGGLNFVAVGRSLDLSDSLFAAAAAADNVVTGLWMALTLVLPARLAGLFAPEPEAADGADGAEAGSATPDLLGPARLRLLDLGALLALGWGLLWAAEATAALVPLPSVLFLTTYALAVAQLPPVRRLSGALLLGAFALHLFFVILGVGSRIAEILAVGVEIFFVVAAVVLLHGLLLFAFAKLARLDVMTTAVASQAAVGGPSTALALAIAHRRPALALPGTVAGLFGYAAGTYAGLGVAYLLRGMLS